MKAMILAAGEGTRLGPYTSKVPKVLLPVGERTFIEHCLAWLKCYGISEVALNLYHLGKEVEEFLGDGSRFGVKITYSREESLLGTAGGVKRMEPFFDGTFVIVYGDVLTDFDLKDMLEYHRSKRTIATIAVSERSNPQEIAIVSLDENSKVISLTEKPSPGSVAGNLGNGGVYIFEKEIFNHIPEGGPSDFAYDVFPGIIALGLPVYAYRLKPDDYLLDIGTKKTYLQAIEDVKAGKVKIKYDR